MTTTLDTLLISTLPDPLHKTVRVPRLVMADGTPLTLELQQLTFNQIADLRERHKDFAVHTVLAGVKSSACATAHCVSISMWKPQLTSLRSYSCRARLMHCAPTFLSCRAMIKRPSSWYRKSKKTDNGR